ncbi:LOW QUALITY PROTEIN: Heat shock transcription factor, X-linked [Plecturocebus cupreus]
MEDKPSLSMARSEERNPRGQGRSSERVPFPPRLDSEIYRHPADPSRAWGYPVSPGSPDLRMLMEEMAFQSLAEEVSSRRPRPDGDVSPQEEDNLLSLRFPQKLWRLVNSNQFSSIWWDDLCKLQFYCHPYFQRDSPHLLVRMKRRVGVKSAPRQREEGQPGAAESRLVPAGTEQQDHTSPSEDEEVTPQPQDPAGPSSQIRSGSAPPATAVMAPHPAVAGDNAPVAQPAGEWSEGIRAHVAPLSLGLRRCPFLCFPGSPTQMNSDEPVVAFPSAPGTLALETTGHPAPGMPPFCLLWVPLPLVASVAAQSAAFMAMFPHRPALPHHCPHCHHVPQCTPASHVLQAYPDDADHHT